MSKDYYSILGVSKNASQDEIKKAFREKAHKHHPDKGGDQEKFKEYNSAYQVLSDPDKRAKYDQFGSSFDQMGGGGGGGFGGFDFSNFSDGGFTINMDDLGDMFGDFFGHSSGGRSNSKRTRKGQDLQMVISLDFKEAIFGIEKEISLTRNIACKHCSSSGVEPGSKIEKCPTCHGKGKVSRIQQTILGSIQMQTTCPTCSGVGEFYTQKCTKCHGKGVQKTDEKIKVKIPAGIDDGQAIRLAGYGEAGQNGASAGDLYLIAQVKKDKRFKRDGFDLYTQIGIGFALAALGGQIEIETINDKVKLKIPEGTQTGTIFKLKNEGVPTGHKKGFFSETSERGDCLVEVKIKTPTNLSKKQKEALRELED